MTSSNGSTFPITGPLSPVTGEFPSQRPVARNFDLSLICAWRNGWVNNQDAVRGIRRSPVNSHHKGQWRGALMCSLIWAWTNGWVNNGDAGDSRRQRHCNVQGFHFWYWDWSSLEKIVYSSLWGINVPFVGGNITSMHAHHFDEAPPLRILVNDMID